MSDNISSKTTAANTTSITQDKQFLFLSLPTELRIMIYDLIFRRTYVRYWPKDVLQPSKLTKTLNVLQVCHQIRGEALPMFFERGEFVFKIEGARRRSWLTSLRISHIPFGELKNVRVNTLAYVSEERIECFCLDHEVSGLISRLSLGNITRIEVNIDVANYRLLTDGPYETGAQISDFGDCWVVICSFESLYSPSEQSFPDGLDEYIEEVKKGLLPTWGEGVIKYVPLPSGNSILIPKLVFRPEGN